MKQIQLTQGKVAVVDDADFEEINQYKWYAAKHKGKFYAGRKIVTKDGLRRELAMHAVIAGGAGADHINGDALDNQRGNLRLCTHQQNTFNSGLRRNNTSGFKGVSWLKDRRKWSAHIGFNGKLKHLGSFATAEEAARAYDAAACKYHGEFARLNFTEQTVQP